MTIKVHYRYLRKCLLGWHESRLGFVTPCDGEVSLGPLGRISSYAQCDQGVDHGMMCYGTSKSDLPVTRLNEVLGYRRSNLGQVTYRLTKGIVYGIA